MFENICTLPLSADIFSQAVHPSLPLVTVGLSSGHVATLQLPPVDDESEPDDVKRSPERRGSNGTDVVDTTWRTKRHQGSCRCLAYSINGEQVYSAGTDGIVKAADVGTGKVIGKVAIPAASSSAAGIEIDAPTVVHALSPQTLLLSTDSGALHLYDLRDPAPSLPLQDKLKTAFTTGRPSQTYHPHADYISSLAPIPASAASTSGYSKQFLTTGSTTLALTDLRRGVLAKSEDQEELLLSSLYITGLPVKKSSGSTGEKAVVGGGDGVITLWEKSQWDDQDERIVVSREKETLDALAQIPDGIGGLGKKVAVGLGDGKIRVVRLGMNKVVGEFTHDEVEGVTALGFDVEGRMISGGGQTLKVWREHIATAAGDDSDDDGATGKRAADSDDDSDAGEADDSSEDEDKGRKRKKKRKRGKAPQNVPSFDFGGLD
ncbi:Putative WD40/YVTN repeat-like-containing domain superfamily [Septoria linicola]|uniref:WD repeat-containing protein JIP5 n=1 Tax=Septoria linicola TaxID=215465 RepID=A0A9Q9APN1_9PEZI|nr:putative WD40/YVTN repeat-like-containing domain superfamily [Septoria linicola]USW48536.1 Putative WD40/YVTN repeat-like-containing domain superfamily [Septoria linicola]